MRVLATRDLRDGHSDYFQLHQAFIELKSGLALPHLLGKDVPYHRPSSAVSARLRHIHVREPDSGWPSYMLQHQRTSNTHLVYCSHYFHADVFLLIALLTPNAHEQARVTTMMSALADIAERFHEQDFQ